MKRILAVILVLFVVLFLLVMCGPQVPGADHEAFCRQAYSGAARTACMGR